LLLAIYLRKYRRNVSNDAWVLPAGQAAGLLLGCTCK
jgi:hypothetical protein